MNTLLASKRLSKTLTLILATSIIPFVQSQVANDDPWFEQQANREATEIESTENTGQSQSVRTSPEKVYKSLLKELEKTSSYALTKQIELLKRAANSGANNSSEAAKQLAGLESTLSNIIGDIETAVTLPSLEAAIDLLAPHKRYFLVDIQLSKRLLDSPLRSRIEQTLAQFSETQDIDKIAALQDALQRSGLYQILGNSLQTALEQSQSDLILQKWAAASPDQSSLQGESFLIRKALGQKDARLPVSIYIRNNDDPRLLNSFQKSLARQLGDTIAPQFDQTADLSVTLEVDKFDLDRQIDEASVESVIPGAIEETENPEFVEMLAKYKNQAEKYEIGLLRYERDHDDWIRTYKDDNGELDKGIEKAEENMEEAVKFAQQTASIFTGYSPEGLDRMDVARLELQQARNMASSASVQNRPEPIPPTPVHLDTLKKVYATPSVIITESEATDYTYTQQEILTTFQSAATLTLSSSSSPLPQTQSLELSRDRKWIRNLGVDSRDPRAQQDNYSEEAIDSTRDLFYLEFASACASKLEMLLSSASQAQLKEALSSRDRQALLIALSLKASSQNLTLPDQERARLYALAKDPSVSGPKLKDEVLESLLKTTLASSAEDLSQALEIIRL